jgi:hypothetical protein
MRSNPSEKTTRIRFMSAAQLLVRRLGASARSHGPTPPACHAGGRYNGRLPGGQPDGEGEVTGRACVAFRSTNATNESTARCFNLGAAGLVAVALGGVLSVRNKALIVIEMEDDTRNWRIFLVYFSHSITMSCSSKD